MSEYTKRVYESFDPLDYISPELNDVETELPENPDAEDILQIKKSAYDQKTRGGAILTQKILAELHHLSEQAGNTITTVKNSGVYEWDSNQKDDLRLFFTFVGQTQEYLLREAIVKCIISSEVEDELKEEIIGHNDTRGWSVRQCIRYLHKADVIDSGLKGNITDARNERNESVHDITRWFFAQFDPSDMKQKTSSAERSVVRLLQIVYEFDLE